MKVLYTAEVTATGDGRNGHVTSTDKLIDVDVARPVEMGGAGGATNPEQLFAAGYSACFWYSFMCSSTSRPQASSSREWRRRASS